MSLFRNVATGLRSLFRKNQVDRELDEELRAYQEMATDEKMKQGMSRKEALRAVRLEQGGVEATKEVLWSARWESFIETRWQDLSFAIRMLRKSPAFTTVAVLTLALGIGANTAIFTLLHASLWRPLPVKNPQEIFHLMRTSSGGDFAGEFSYSYPLFQQLSKIAASWGEMFATETVSPRKFSLDSETTERIVGEAVSANFFSVLHVEPSLGRVLEPQDDSVLGGNHFAVLSHGFWMRRFHFDDSILGKTIFYDEVPYTVVGVAQPGFFGIEPEVSVDVWVPITATSAGRGWRPDPNINWLRLLLRLRPGVDVSQAQGMFEAAFRAHVADTLMPGASPRWKSMLEGQHVTLRPARSGLATTGRTYEKPLLVLFAVVVVVLLISCANIANLILARNAVRRQEIVVRLALGASRGRIAWQLFTEHFLLSFAGAVCAIFLSVWGTRLLLSLLPQSPLPLAFDLRPDFAVFGFAVCTAFVTATLFGLGPALRASSERPEMSFRGGHQTTASSSTGRLLLVGQFALTLPLLVGAGLFLETLHNLKSSDLGFRPENVVTFDFSFPKSTSDDRLRQAYAEIKERLESHPGVLVASYSSPSVYGNGGWSGRVDVLGNPTPGEDNDVGLISAGPGLFQSIGLGLLQGRYLNSQDQAEKPPVVVVNESFARHYFGAQSVIGQRIKLGFEPQIIREIVGVVRDARHYGVRERVWRMVYVPVGKSWKGGAFYVRANVNAHLLSDIIRADVAASDKILQVEGIRPFEGVINDMISEEHLTALLSSVFAALACLLAAIGLYGVFAYSVSRRTNEFGIRMALGAQRRDIRTLVLRQTLGVTLAGVAIGITVALGLARTLAATIAGMLYGIQPTDIGLFVGATVSLIAVALVAALLPARRATHVDPLVALRYE
jgi:predicted permease